ncbi:MAG: KTSC domain-containing protein [Clostridia bacterium]|nr:KTSC domain-containing protein [Clostridia bacterium]
MIKRNIRWHYLFHVALALALCLTVLVTDGCGNEECNQSNYVDVKYSDSSVNLEDSRFEYLSTAGSSFINGAWYDSAEEYMVIELSGTYYHYCGMPESIWKEFKKAGSFGTYYNDWIKGKYGCD